MIKHKSLEDTELLRFLQHGDHGAYKEIYERYWSSLYRHSLRMLQDTDLAKDVVQDVFVMLWARRNELDLHTSLSSFLYASVRNRTLNQIDHSKVRSDYMVTLQNVIEEGAFSTDELINGKELAKIIEAELENLPKKMRMVFELSRKHDYSYREIAEELCITDHTVKKQMSNALRILRTRISLLLTFF